MMQHVFLYMGGTDPDVVIPLNDVLVATSCFSSFVEVATLRHEINDDATAIIIFLRLRD